MEDARNNGVRLCPAGRWHALPPEDWPHSLHRVLHFWKRLRPVQVSRSTLQLPIYVKTRTCCITDVTNIKRYLKALNADLLYSTMFLMGPVKQLKRMCDKTRALATTIMIVSTQKCIFLLI